MGKPTSWKPTLRKPSVLLAVVLFAGSVVRVLAQDAQKPASEDARKAEFQAAAAAAEKAEVKGPKDVKLGSVGTLHLPAGDAWIPHDEADRYMRAAGHRSNPSLLGIISGGTDQHGYIAIVTYTGEGHVKDDDARDLDPAKILASLREGQDEDNKAREERGFEPLVLDDWLQPPAYDAANKWLVWALPVHTSATAATPTINYNTRALGREGYISLNLLTDTAHFDGDKGEAGKLLKSISYDPGHRYTDFNPTTDRVAAYGLAALIGAVALKKLGILALAGAFILKFAKLGVVLLIGVFAAIKRFFVGRNRDDPGG